MEITPLENQISVPGRGKVLEVDVSALYDELSEVDDGNGLLMSEICVMIGKCERVSRKFVRTAIEMGRCTATKRTVTYIDGRKSTSPAYIFHEPSKD